MVGGVAQAARRPARLPSASTPDVPFCAVATVAVVVDLMRRSAPLRGRKACRLCVRQVAGRVDEESMPNTLFCSSSLTAR